MKATYRGFTLIELLIVVAIIAILAGIALPNFLEAQIRAKVARGKSDFRALATAIEAYCVDEGQYPWKDDAAFNAWYASTTGESSNQYSPLSYRAAGITTPIAYIGSVDFRDPFVQTGSLGGYNDNLPRYQYNYRNYKRFITNPADKLYGETVWVLNSLGPDGMKNQGLNVEYLARGLPNSKPTVLYDATNGTVSPGDVPWTGGMSKYQNQ